MRGTPCPSALPGTSSKNGDTTMANTWKHPAGTQGGAGKFTATLDAF